MSEIIIMKRADIEDLARSIADVVAMRLEPLLETRQRRLVDRIAMARMANIGTATLDRLVTSKRIPSVLINRRRLFDPDAVIMALNANPPSDAPVSASGGPLDLPNVAP